MKRYRKIKVYVINQAGVANLRLMHRCPITKKKIYRTSGTTRVRDAERAAARWEEELNATRERWAGGSWENFRKRFTDEHLAKKSEATRDNFRHALNRFERDNGIPADIMEVTGSVLSGWQQKMAKTLSQSSVASNLRCLRAALNWASKVGIISQAPKVVMPESGGSRGRPLTLWEFIRFFREIPKNFPECPGEASRLVLGLWLSGLRISEALELRWPPSETAPTIHLAGKSHPHIHWPHGSHKAQSADATPITPDFLRFLSRVPEASRVGLVFPVPLAPSTIAKRISQAGVASGVDVKGDKHASAHDLRRTFGNRWALRVHPLVLRAIMRHASMETTLRYYVDLRLEQLGDSLWASAQNSAQHGTGLTAGVFGNAAKRGK